MLDDHSALAFVILIFGVAYLFALKFYPELARFLLVSGGAALGAFLFGWIESKMSRVVFSTGAMAIGPAIIIGLLTLAAGCATGGWVVWRLTRPRAD
jgi:hypothetical protein